MSFLVWAALGIVGLVAAPLLAHLLRRGRAVEREFPATSLVPHVATTARERSRLEDLPLLVVRGAMITGLAVLGATPLVRCERLSLSRSAGASVALAVVLDDSLSMRAALPSGRTRWDLAKQGAEQLLASARDGDAVTLVLAGRPARIALAPTTDLGSARSALSELRPSDRSTDLAAATTLARSALRALPQRDHRVVVLSDLAGDPLPGGSPEATTPLVNLTTPVDDCAVASAERHGGRVAVLVACTSPAAASGRKVKIVVVAPPRAPAGGKARDAGDVVGEAALHAREGEQSLSIDVDAPLHTLDARLEGKDAAEADDGTPVAEQSASPRVGVVADAATSSAKTGGATVVEQALAALEEGWVPSPIPAVPDDAKALTGMGALVLDDPRGFSPEARSALASYLDQGGVALALLGPRSATPELGSTLEPFARGAVRWEDTASGLGVDPPSVGWLGPEGASLGALARRGRVRLDGAAIDGARVAGKWTDGAPFLLERPSGRGLVLTAGLPASLDESDIALRPGFLALLDHVLRQADVRSGARRTSAGTPWSFPSAKEVSIMGPDGPLPVTAVTRDAACTGTDPSCNPGGFRAEPAVQGRYTVRVDGLDETRLVTLEAAEVLATPRAPGAVSSSTADRAAALSPATQEAAIVLLLLFAAELALRIQRSWAARRREAG